MMGARRFLVVVGMGASLCGCSSMRHEPVAVPGEKPAGATAASVATPANESIAGLMADLGCLEYARREAAGRQLEERWKESLPLLRQVESTPDPEVRMRAREILARIRARHRVQEYLGRGAEACAQGRLEQADELLATAIVLDPDRIQAHQILGEVREKQGKPREAIAEYSRALKIDSSSAETYCARADVWVRLGGLDEALSDLDRAIELEPMNANLYPMRAVIWLRKGEVDKAIDDCSRVLCESPEHAEALVQRAEALARKKRYDEAVIDMRLAIENGPIASELYAKLARYLMEAGRKDEADLAMKQLLEVSDGSPAALNEKAWVLCTAPDARLRDGVVAVSNALVACEQTKFEKPEYVDTLAAAYAEVGDFTNAVLQQKKATIAIEEDLRPGFQYRLDLYRAGKPYREDGSMEAWLEQKEKEARRQEPAASP